MQKTQNLNLSVLVASFALSTLEKIQIWTKSCDLKAQGTQICDLVSSGAKNTKADLIYNFADILTKSKRYIDYIVGGTKCNVYACCMSNIM